MTQELQLRAVWKSYRSGSIKQSWPCGNPYNNFLQDSNLVLDDSTVSKALMPQCHHWELVTFRCWFGSWSGSRLRCVNKHYQWRAWMWYGVEATGGGSYWVLQEVLWLAWSWIWKQSGLLQPKVICKWTLGHGRLHVILSHPSVICMPNKISK